MSGKQKLALTGGAVLITAILVVAAMLLSPSYTQPEVLPTVAALPDGVDTQIAVGLTPVMIPAEPVPDRVVLRFADNADPAQVEAYIAQIGGTTVQQIDALNTIVLDLPAGTAADLPSSPLVQQNEPDFFVGAMLDLPTSDPRYAEQWALPVIGAPDAWRQISDNAPTVTVAVIDSGVCASHPDLAGRVLAGWSFLDSSDQVNDGFGHGCAVSGILAANIDDGIGMAGAAPNVNILPLRVLNDQGIGTYSSVAAAIVYAADHDADIINLSLGGTSPSTLLEGAVNYAVSQGSLVIAAAGNSGTEGVYYPARYPAAIAVGSVDPTLQRSSFSAFGQGLDLLAPGRSILATKPDGSYTTVSGTSFAAPYASGVAALEIALGGELVVDGGIAHVSSVSAPPPPVPTAPPDTTGNRIDQDVLDALSANGSARVIVALNTPISAQAASPERAAAVAQAQESVLAQLANTDFVLAQQFTQLPAFAGLLTLDSVSVLQANENVLSVYIDEPTVRHDLESGPLIGSNVVNGAYGIDGAGVRVAVLDTGVDANRVGIAGSVVAEHCFASGDAPLGGPGGCPDGSIQQDGPGSAADSAAFHGTNVAAIITADPGGVAPASEIVAVRVLDQFGRGFTSDWIAGLDWIAQNNAALGVDVVNMSLGTVDLFAPAPGSNATSCNSVQDLQIEAQSVALLNQLGITVVSSTGNGGSLQGISAPACLDGVISVGAVYDSALGAEPDPNGSFTTYRDYNGPAWPACRDANAVADQITCFTNRNVWVDLLAPGAQIIVAKTGGAGTSQAAPHVAGVAALIVDQSDDDAGAAGLAALTPQQIADLMRNTGRLVNDPATGLNIRRVDALAAIDEILVSAPIFSCANSTDVPQSECQALVDLYESTNGDGWAISTNWLSSTSICSWYGIQCSGNSVSSIDLGSVGLFGTIPASLGSLSELTFLSLYQNAVSGPIPPELGNLSNLTTLTLGQNQLTGSIPTELGNLTNLTSLGLWTNQLTGSIPASLGNLTNLQTLTLSENQLTGSIPTELGNLTLLDTLALNNNQLTGSIPTELGNLGSLDVLSLANNALTGSIPSELGNLSLLSNLNLSYNSFTGSIPPEFGNLTDLATLVIESVPLTGSLPPELGNITGLSYLNISFTDISGSIPPELGNLPSLSRLFLHNNQLTGQVPVALNGLDNLNTFDVSDNHLSGPFPSIPNWAVSLNVIDLSNNDFTGSLPSFFQYYSPIISAYFAYNNFDGFIPDGLANASGLVDLSLDYNQLNLTDPDYISFVTGINPTALTNQTLPPVDVTVGTKGTNSVNLSWTPPAFTGDSGYFEMEANPGEGPSVFDRVTSPTTSGAMRGLNNGNEYGIRVRTVNNVLGPDGRERTHTSAWSSSVNSGALGTSFCASNDFYTRFDIDQCYALENLYNSTNGPSWTNRTGWLSPTFLTQVFVGEQGISRFNPSNINPISTNPFDVLFNNVPDLDYTDRDELLAVPDRASNQVKLYDPLTGQLIYTVANPGVDPLSVELLEFVSQTYLAIGDANGRVYVMSYGSTGSTLIRTIDVPNGDFGIVDLAYNSWTGRLLVGVDANDSRVYEYFPTSGTLIRTFTSDTSVGDSSVAVSYDGNLIATGSAGTDGNNNVYIYAANSISTTPLRTLTDNTASVTSLEFEPFAFGDQRLLVGYGDAGSSTDAVARIYNASTGALLQTLSGHTDMVYDAAWYGPSFVVTLGRDDTLRRWNTSTGAQTHSRTLGFAGAQAVTTIGETMYRPCEWYGVTCDLTDTTVTTINLQQNNLSGVLSDSLNSFIDLTELFLAENNLIGSMPGLYLSALRSLDLSQNSFTGSLPDLSGLPVIDYLNLSINKLTGPIPAALTNRTSLDLIYLNDNDLTGPIPSGFGSMPDLVNLLLQGNALTGSIPSDLGNSTTLTSLNLGANQLTGSIPPELGDISTLQYLYLNFNQLTGSIPIELSNLVNLVDLNLAINNLSGSIPPELGNLTALQVLGLNYNQLTGPIPPELGALTDLVQLVLSNNQLTGPIPTSFGGLPVLNLLHLENNQLSGSIPPELASSSQIASLNLEKNQLTGSIPPALGSMPNLTFLFLGENQLTGQIPPELGNATTLRQLGLEANALSGEVPADFVNLTDLLPNGLNLRWNSLTAPDTGDLLSFLADKAGSWQDTQTVAPENFQVGTASGTGIVFSWAPITFTDEAGYYAIECSDLPGVNPFTEVGRTPNKSASSLLLPNSALTLDQSCHLRSVTEGPFEILNTLGFGVQSNTLISDPTAAIDLAFAPEISNEGTVVVPTVPAVITISTNDVPEVPVPEVTCPEGRSVIFEGRSVIFEGRSVIFEGRSVIFEGRSVIFEGSTEGSTYDTFLTIWSAPAGTQDPLNSPDLTLEACNDNTTSNDPLNGDTERPPGSTTETSRVSVPFEEDKDYYVIVYSKDPDGGTLRLTVDLRAVDNVVTIPQAEADALVDLYLATNGPNWTNSQNWIATSNPCEWYGVTCGAGHVVGLELSANSLNGTLPASISNLTFLDTLDLSYNALVSVIPDSFTSLTALSTLDLFYNGLYSANAEINAFITARNNGWDATQTVAPSDVAVTVGSETENSFDISWSPISYTGDDGFYRAPCALNPGGPYVGIPVNETTSKFTSALTVGQLLPGSTYYCTVQTVTLPHGAQFNTVESDLSAEVSAATLLPEGLEGSAPDYTLAENITFPYIFQGNTSVLDPNNPAIPNPSCSEAGGRSVIFEGRSVIFEGRSVIFEGRSVIFEGRSVIFEGSTTDFDHTVSIWSAPAGTEPTTENLTEESCSVSEVQPLGASALSAFTAAAQVTYQAGKDYYVIVTGNNAAGGNLNLQINLFSDDTVENNLPVVAADQDVITVNEGEVAENTGTASDADAGDSLTLSASPLGTVTFTSPVAWAWSYQTTDDVDGQTVTIVATDDKDIGSDTFTLNVTNVAPTAIFGISDESIEAGQTAQLSLSNPVDPSDADLANLTYAFSCVDDTGASFMVENSSTASFDCSYNSAGTYLVAAQVSDDDGGSTLYTGRIVVSPVTPLNQPPVANNDSTSTSVNTLVTIDVRSNDTDPDDANNTLVITSVTDPAHGAAVNNNNGTVTYTPDTGYFGGDTFDYTVCDPDNACDTGTVSITVNQVVAEVVTITIPVDRASDDVNEDGTGIDLFNRSLWVGNGQSAASSYTGLRFNGVTIPEGAEILEARVEFYNPAITWIRLNLIMGVEAADSSATFSNTSRPSQRALSAVVVPHSSDELWLPGTWYTLGDITPLIEEVLARAGWNSGNSLSVIMRGTNGQWARKFISSFDTSADFAPRLVVTYRTSGAVPNVPPVANDDVASTLQNNQVIINVRGNDTDADDQVSSLTITSVTNPAHGIVVNNNNGTITYIPASGYNGPDSFSYTLCDPDNACDTAIVNITVEAPPTDPVTGTFQVKNGGDDVNEDGTNFSAASSSVWVGNGASAADSTLGLRFTGVNIPRGSVITSARVEFYSQAAQWISISANMAAEAADNSAAFSANNRPSQRALTTSIVPHSSNVLWNAGSWNTLGEITGVVQEVVSRSGWQMGNSLSVIMDGTGSPFGRKFVTAYEGGAAFAPRLVVTFIVPAEAAGLALGLSDVIPPEPPVVVAGFTPSALQGLAPLAVTLSNTSTGPFDTVTWAVNDVPTSTESSPTLTFAAPGIYTVSLTVSGPAGSSTAQSVISVGTPAAPVAAVSASILSGTAPVSVQFTNLSSGAITSYAWDFGDGQSSTEASPAHTYTAAGTYTVTLITSGPGGMSSAQTTITVTEVPPEPPAAPVASFSSSVGEDGITVSFTNSSTGEVTGYAWDFGDGQSSIEASPVHTYPAPGTYTVTLIVSGAGGMVSTQAQVTVGSSS